MPKRDQPHERGAGLRNWGWLFSRQLFVAKPTARVRFDRVVAIDLRPVDPDIKAGYASMAACLAAVGFFGGFYLVPLATTIQQRPNIEEKGAVIALSSTISFVGVALASLIYYVCKTQLGFSLLDIFMLSGFMTLAAGVYIKKTGVGD